MEPSRNHYQNENPYLLSYNLFSSILLYSYEICPMRVEDIKLSAFNHSCPRWILWIRRVDKISHDRKHFQISLAIPPSQIAFIGIETYSIIKPCDEWSQKESGLIMIKTDIVRLERFESVDGLVIYRLCTENLVGDRRFLFPIYIFLKVSPGIHSMSV